MAQTRLDAAAVALLLPADSAPELVVLLTEPEAPDGILVDLHGHRSAFFRVRRGPIAHGIVEPYQECDPWERSVRGFHRVTDGSHRLCRLNDAGRMFGSGDAGVLVPVRGDGELWPELGIPANGIGRPRRVVLARGELAESGYGIADELEDEGWVCTICGRVTPNPEPHTADHGVPGHVRAGVLPGEPLDETRAYALH